MHSLPHLTAFVSWPSAPFTESLVRRTLEALPFPLKITSLPPESLVNLKLIQWSTYDQIDHELTHLHHRKVLSSTYIFRKALIRKHFLSRHILSYVTKHPASLLKTAAPQTFEIELSFADELDELWTDELWELGEKLENTHSWWILKPGMADRGMGIRLFNSKEALAQIFKEFEDDSDSDESERGDKGGTAVATSQLRHFVIQEYVLHPLLFDPSDVKVNEPSKAASEPKGYKFHLRAYCVSSGALQLYLYNRILALFSAVPYIQPDVSETEDGDPLPVDLAPHLTNTSLQSHRGGESVRLLEELVGCQIMSGDCLGQAKLTAKDVVDIIAQMMDILAETFKAALASPVHFQPLPNAFELYGIDFLVAHTTFTDSETPLFQVKLLEINAEPAIELTGLRLSWILEDLFVAMRRVCIEPFLFGTHTAGDANGAWAVGEARHNLIKCLDEEVRGNM